MTKIVLDACVPQWLRNEFADYNVETAHFAGCAELSDVDLLAAKAVRFFSSYEN